ncbi:sulfurtransferase [Jatrophihabitans sp.]|uniref:sulfurtransferase n=1 Tax=Jatrophihabitans sp. TaxID=1932789 RepID=UPI0030C66CB6|nr:Thiosulfate/3-mercaptopyruvate sulfurtransferase [Jatrophihabitans sp.]
MSFGPLVSGEWLSEHLEQVRLVDVRWYLDGRSGRAAYDAGHLPGAVWLDIDTDLAEPAGPSEGRHPLASPERFAAALGRVGIAAGQPVVAYDDAGGSTAARLWWMLHVLGEPVAVLDGGLAAWRGPLVTTVAEVAPVEREPRPWPAQRFRTEDDVAALPAGTALYDARSAARYAAGDPAIDPRPGHIPGAASAPWADNLGPDGRFRPPAELRTRYGDGPAVAYCGSGVTGCHDLLALAVAGNDDTALYPGSFSQWGSNTARPVENG